MTVSPTASTESPGVMSAVGDPARLQMLDDAGLLDDHADMTFDRIARLATAVVGAPASFVSVVSPDMQVMPGSVELDDPGDASRTLPAADAFCKFTVATGEPLVIPDSSRSPLVQRTAGARSGSISAYAGFPLRNETGVVLGTLCVIDRHPRPWSDDQMSLLNDLAGLAADQMNVRVSVGRLRRLADAARAVAEQVHLVSAAAPGLLGRVEASDDAQIRRYAALVGTRTENLVRATSVLDELLAEPADSSDGPPPVTDLRAVAHQSVRSVRAATGSDLLELQDAKVSIPVSAEPVELERAVTHLLVTALQHGDDASGVTVVLDGALAGNGSSDDLPTLRVVASGAHVPTGELTRAVARFSAATGEGNAGQVPAVVKVSRGTTTVRSGSVTAASSRVDGLTFAVRLPRPHDTVTH